MRKLRLHVLEILRLANNVYVWYEYECQENVIRYHLPSRFVSFALDWCERHSRAIVELWKENKGYIYYPYNIWVNCVLSKSFYVWASRFVEIKMVLYFLPNFLFLFAYKNLYRYKIQLKWTSDHCVRMINSFKSQIITYFRQNSVQLLWEDFK